jgi:Na+/melibiose symporter-like transporter
MEISENSIERDSATAWRMTSELLATSLGVVLFGLVLAQLAPEGSSTDAERRIAYFAGSLVICCFVVVPGFIATCCVPERPEYCVQRADGPIASADRSEQSNLGPTAAAPGFFGEWLAGLKLAFSCPSYLVLMLCFLCSGLTFQLTSNNLNLYLRHTLDVADQFQIIVSHSELPADTLVLYITSTQH